METEKKQTIAKGIKTTFHIILISLILGAVSYKFFVNYLEKEKSETLERVYSNNYTANLPTDMAIYNHPDTDAIGLAIAFAIGSFFTIIGIILIIKIIKWVTKYSK